MKVLYALMALVVLIGIAVIGVGALNARAFFGIGVPYTAMVIFLVGFVYRVISWARKPVPFHIPTVTGQQKMLSWIKHNKIESPANTGGTIVRMALEILLFRSLFRNERAELKQPARLISGGNKYLWLGGLVLHWSLLVIFLRHSSYFLQPVPSPVSLLQGLDGFFKSPATVLYVTDITVVIALTYLFARRVVFAQVRYISLPADYFALFLIGGVVVSGILTKLVFRVDLPGVKELALGLISFRPVIPSAIGLSFYVHFFLVSMLFVYFPFSKLMHMPGVLFSVTRNLPNNSRAHRHLNPVDKPVRVHSYAEWEDEFRSVIKEAGLPLEKEK